MSNIEPPITVLRMKQLVKKIGISRSSVYEKMNPKSPRYDKTFPRPFKLGKSAVGWFESDINQWLMQRHA
ncbi:AlpA family phage regulatory protein [Halomonas sp. XH26]|uniref:AlpA family phage regulatory protein n=1 Tax=Halomonas qaidamensis TaxID=2866211 RepID=A0ABY6JVI4_9GAMM|nr:MULTISPECIES: AlpA family phage regulatory protein [Halomonas]UTA81526.1 AlpA family phage regulatory protein [Halomonas sp. XH26]UYV20602.1 AlpA family phage regulatory protein [Halomonas qaidamensis]